MIFLTSNLTFFFALLFFFTLWFPSRTKAYYTQLVQILSTSLPELLTAELAGIRWAPSSCKRDSSPAPAPQAADEVAIPATAFMDGLEDEADHDGDDDDSGDYFS